MNDRPAMAEAEYSGPPAYVPVSGLAVTALVLSILFAVVAMFGPWWCGIVPILLAAFAWPSLSRRTRRGKPVAIIAVVIALLSGGYAYRFQESVSELFGDQVTPVVAAAEKGDRAELAKWIPEGPDREAKIDRWIARAKAAHAAQGDFRGPLRVPFNLLGVFKGVASTPDVREEFEPKADASLASGVTFWFRAAYATGDVYVAFDCGSTDRFMAFLKEIQGPPGSKELNVHSTQEAFAKAVEEVRYFR